MFTEELYLYYEKQKRKKKGYLHNCQNRTPICVCSPHYCFQRWYSCDEAWIPKANLVKLSLIISFNILGLIIKCIRV